MNRYVACACMIFLGAFLRAAPEIIIPHKQKKGVAFTVGARVKYSYVKTTLTTRIINKYKSAYFLGEGNDPLFGNGFWNAAAQDYRLAMLDGIGPTGVHDNPSEEEYTGDLFDPYAAERAFVEPKEYEVVGKALDTPNLSHMAFDVTTGVVYTIDEYIGFWFKGMYSFGLNFGKNGVVKRDHYDIEDTKDAEYAAVGGGKITADVVALTYASQNGNIAKDTKMTVDVSEGFSVLLGGRFTPAPQCVVDFGAGFRRYLVQCKWTEGSYAYPHPEKILTQDHIQKDGENVFWVPYKEAMILEGVFWPFVLQVEAAYVAGKFNVTLGFEYSSFEGSLTEKNPAETKTSKSQKEDASVKRVQKYPTDYPSFAHLRPQDQQKVWAMSVLKEIDVIYKAQVAVSSFSFTAGVSLTL